MNVYVDSDNARFKLEYGGVYDQYAEEIIFYSRDIYDFNSEQHQHQDVQSTICTSEHTQLYFDMKAMIQSAFSPDN